MERVVLLASQIIDGTENPPLRDAGILIKTTKLCRPGPRAEMERTPGARVMNFGGWTLLPGLMDAHIHLDGWKRPTVSIGSLCQMPCAR